MRTNLLVRPARAHELNEIDRDSYSSWGKGLTPDQYLHREQVLREHPWSRDAMKTWLLEDPRSGERLASCETFRMTSRHHAEPGTTFGICSVFVPEEHRGHGHASTLLSFLVPLLKSTTPNLHAIILFSDVGEKIYARLGYRSIPALSTRWSALELQQYFSPSQARARLLEIGYLHDSRPTKASWSKRDRTASFELCASTAQADWHWEREAFYRLQLQLPRADSHAVLAANGECHAAWTFDVREKKFRILWLDASSAEEEALFLSLAAHEAIRSGCDEIEFWGEAQTPGKIFSREETDSLPMLLPISSPLVREAEESPMKEIWKSCPRIFWM